MKKVLLYLLVLSLFVLASCGGSGKGGVSDGKKKNKYKVERKRTPVPAKPNKIAYHLNANRIFRDGNDVHLGKSIDSKLCTLSIELLSK